MSLRETAAADLRSILGDRDRGFAWDLTVTNPDGVSESIRGYSADITQLVDPDTGSVVRGRYATVSIPDNVLAIGQPVGVEDKSLKPWIVEFLDLRDNAYKFKVRNAWPDRTVDIRMLELEKYVD